MTSHARWTYYITRIGVDQYRVLSAQPSGGTNAPSIIMGREPLLTALQAAFGREAALAAISQADREGEACVYRASPSNDPDNQRAGLPMTPLPQDAAASPSVKVSPQAKKLIDSLADESQRGPLPLSRASIVDQWMLSWIDSAMGGKAGERFEAKSIHLIASPAQKSTLDAPFEVVSEKVRQKRLRSTVNVSREAKNLIDTLVERSKTGPGPRLTQSNVVDLWMVAWLEANPEVGGGGQGPSELEIDSAQYALMEDLIKQLEKRSPALASIVRSAVKSHNPDEKKSDRPPK